MSRLYQKFFLFFFLANFSTVTGVGITIWLQQNQHHNISIDEHHPRFENEHDLHEPPFDHHSFLTIKHNQMPGAVKHFEQRFEPPPIFPILPLLAGTLISFIFAALLAWYFSKPIKNLSAAFNDAANGQLQVRVSPSLNGRKDELADLGRDFDAMAARLGNLIEGQNNLLHHVSHELRSPLARIQMAIGLARQNAEKIPSSIARIERESERMDKLVGELLELSRLESGAMHIHKESLEIRSLLKNVIEDAQYEADNKSITIQTLFEQDFHVVGEMELLHRALENVVRNAIKFSPINSQITLSVTQYGKKILQINIQDQGEGVAESELTTIFKPFVRSSFATSNHGHGIGLAIAKQIIEAHGGTIEAHNIVDGFLVAIQLPYTAYRKSPST